MAALTTAQRTTIRNAYIALANNNVTAWTKDGRMTAAQFADGWLAVLDAYRAQTRPRAHYTLRVQPWIPLRLTLSTTVRNAITTHCNGG